MDTYDLAIIGTGSGNSILDDRYAGHRVAICEQGTFGGTCLNVGCIPTKMFVYAAEVANTVRNAARYGVDAHIDAVRWPTSSPGCSAGSIRSRPAARTTGAAHRTSTSTTVPPASPAPTTARATCCAPTRARSSAPRRW